MIPGFVIVGVLLAFWQSIVTMGIALLAVIVSSIQYFSTYYLLTDLKLETQTGVLLSRNKQLPLAKVESLSTQQGPLGMLLDYGDVVVSGTGGHELVLRHVGNPEKVRLTIRAAVEAMRER